MDYRNASPANLADVCAIPIPCSREGGPPTICTLMMASGEDKRLLHLAETLEAVINPIRRGYSDARSKRACLAAPPGTKA